MPFIPIAAICRAIRFKIILLEISERVYTGENSGLRVCSRLVFCIDQRLILRFEVEQWGGYAFQIQDEQELSCEMAVKSYGLDAICAGLLPFRQRPRSAHLI